MRTNSRLAVGSPTMRVAAIMVATLLAALMVVGAGVAGSQLLAAAGPIVVDQSGGGDYTTITEAVAAAEDGDEINVRPGTYTEAVVIAKDITVAGDGPIEEIVLIAPDDGPTEIASDSVAAPYAVAIHESEAKISGMTLRGERSQLHLSGGSPTASELVLDGVGRAYTAAAGAGRDSIVVVGDSAATIKGNTITSGGAIGVHDLAEPLIEGNVLTGGPHIWGDFGDGTVIRGNLIDGTVARAIGVFVDSALTIESNEIRNPGTVGIELAHGGTAQIIGNKVTGATSAGILVPDGNVTLASNQLDDNMIGIAWTAPIGLIEGNVVSGGRAGIVVSAGSPQVTGNSVEGVDGRGLAVAGLGSAPTLSANTSCGNVTNLYIADGAEPVDDGTNEICEDATAE